MHSLPRLHFLTIIHFNIIVIILLSSLDVELLFVVCCYIT